MNQLYLQRLRHPRLAIGVMLSFAFVTGALTIQVTKHSIHHTHQHTATTHASPLCTWMCTAGQVLQTFDVALPAPVHTVVPLKALQPSTVVVSAKRDTPSRSPPLHSSLLA